MVPSAPTATPRGSLNSADPAGPSTYPARDPATTLTAPAGVTRRMVSSSTTMASPPGATATATGWRNAVLTVVTFTPGRYRGVGAPAGNCIVFSAAGSVPSP